MSETYKRKYLPLSRRRLSTKRGWVQRRRLMKQLQTILEDDNSIETNNTKNQSLYCQESINRTTPDVIDLENATDKILNVSTIKVTIKENKYEKVDNSENDDVLVVDNTGVLDIGAIQENLPEGRRIVDLRFVLREVRRSYVEHKRGIDCSFNDWIPVKFHCRGLLTQVFYKCKMCHYETSIWSEPTESDKLDINTAAVSATITAGIGYSTLHEMCAGNEYFLHV
ncbi:uncharacterized protein LOC118648030 [Monomorium pharaonis]|uniref:uncharacterized protein LOC118648030 n=1 Tax=Monomorium pharaonis TaxID=307658 RepID=UPI00174774C5|nr:uncharacterized protein LOC118648030 [Monomorium pharaonis]